VIITFNLVVRQDLNLDFSHLKKWVLFDNGEIMLSGHAIIDRFYLLGRPKRMVVAEIADESE
jgi:hypothetical protein